MVSLREELAQRTLDEAKGRVGDKAGDRVRLAQLEDEAKAKRRELDVLRDRFEAARSGGTSKAVPVEVQVIATARPSSRAAWPNRAQIAALAAAATFVLGLVFVLFRELLAGGQRTARRPERNEMSNEPALAVPAAAPVPRPVAAVAPAAVVASAAAMTARSPVVSDESAPRVASTAGVVERLLGNSAGQAGYRTLVVGDADGIDVREEAADIAAGLSSAGRQVVLVDWSLDGKGVAEALGLDASPGFTELMAGTVSFEDVIRVLPDGDVHVLPCGAASAAASRGIEADPAQSPARRLG